ncbi:MAG: hypothetical protein BHW65_07910 [Verrucomicrobia bacterium CAG:312_58_20]|nr:MAG: hypothetical protein BHW65_07910 [Verrucomicrobia bacterium CAG:312_58_20]PWL66308.1 MAG: hypothetical protein DBY30_05210 [Verrucomicrobiota bacterium]
MKIRGLQNSPEKRGFRNVLIGIFFLLICKSNKKPAAFSSFFLSFSKNRGKKMVEERGGKYKVP